MLKKVVRLTLLGLVLALAVWILLRIVIETDTKRIARLVEQGRRGIVCRDVDRVMSVIAPDYDDGFGMDYDGLEYWMDVQFRTYDSITCVIPWMRIAAQRPEASCTLAFWFAGYYLGRRFPASESGVLDVEPLYADELVLQLRYYEGTGWRIVRASP